MDLMRLSFFLLFKYPEISEQGLYDTLDQFCTGFECFQSILNEMTEDSQREWLDMLIYGEHLPTQVGDTCLKPSR